MMTVKSYMKKVEEILDFNEIDTFDIYALEEDKWMKECCRLGIPPSICAFSIGDTREAYEAELIRERMYDRIDEQLRRAA